MFSTPGSESPHGSGLTKSTGPSPSKGYDKIVLEATPQGFRAYKLKLAARLGPELKATLKIALETEDFDPSSSRVERMHSMIFDEMIKGMDGQDTLMLRMTEKCGELGPKCMAWLQETLDPKDTASSLVTLMAILADALGADVVSGIETKIDLNAALPPAMKLSDEILEAVILTKMPADLRHVRDIVVDKDQLPSIDQLRVKVKNAVRFYTPEAVTPPAHTYVQSAPYRYGAKKCVNCNSLKHERRACDKAKAECKYCGPLAGHIRGT
jgi:hypothetical protein